MKLRINGQEREFSPGSTLAQVVQNFCKDTDRVISELNGQIIKTNQRTSVLVNDGDTIELVTFVGGG